MRGTAILSAGRKLIKRVEENLAMEREGSACKHEEGWFRREVRLLWIHPAIGWPRGVCSIGYRMMGCFVMRVKEVGRIGFGGWMPGYCNGEVIWLLRNLVRRRAMIEKESADETASIRFRRFNFQETVQSFQIYIQPEFNKRIHTYLCRNSFYFFRSIQLLPSSIIISLHSKLFYIILYYLIINILM